jgi:hypothetical protein
LKRDPVTSENIKEIGYDESLCLLEIEFHHGGVYQYEGVPKHVWHELTNSTSLNEYFRNEILGVYTMVRP